MRLQILRKFGLCAVVCASAFAACRESPTDLPATPQSLLGIDLSIDPLPTPELPTPVICPSYETFISTETITPEGGVVRAGRSVVRIPEGALTAPTQITLTVPASIFVQIEIRANDLEHFQFEKPIRVQFDYSACPWWVVDDGPLSVWYWNPLTLELLENMNAEDQAWIHQKMLFRTDHLSGYVIAN